MLVSPHFLFRIERDPEPDRSDQGPPDLRSRTGVAAELFPVELDARRRAARRSPKPASCATPACCDAQVKRMLADPRSVRVRRQLRRPVAGDCATSTCVKPDPQKFPEWRPELRDAMKTETRMFFESHPAREPAALRFPGRELHLPQRAAGEALRHRGVTGPSSAGSS